MQFDNSGLPPIRLIEDAFNYSRQNILDRQPEMLVEFKRQINQMFDMEIETLRQMLKSGVVKQDEFDLEMKDLEQTREIQMRMGPELVGKAIDKDFANLRLRPARALFKALPTVAPEVVAGLLLVNTIRSPRDFQRVESSFGPVVAAVVADTIDIQAYTAKKAERLPAADPLVRSAIAGMILANFDSLCEQSATMLKQGRKVIFPPGAEEIFFRDIKAVTGADAGLDKALVESFNITAKTLHSLFVIEADAKGALTLVKKDPPVPPANNGPNKNLPVVIPKPKGKGGIGDDVF